MIVPRPPWNISADYAEGDPVLAVDVTSFLPDPDSRSDQALRACLDQSWTISRAALDRNGDELMAIADGRIAGVWTITTTHRDPESNTVTFELGEAPQWDWAIGRTAPRSRSLGQASWLRSVPQIYLTDLWDQQPAVSEAKQGWTLDVAADGRSAIVRGPSPHLQIVSLADGTATLALPESPRQEEP
ncbi:hypothetical protein ACZ91_09400 [Streptomyces regensis]|uniref:Uncharacterized protein n=1 Tax=Prauserella rugosa TaxID=43354 RepID=A0A660CB49_9PSEU|nr:hypothetical protein ACZ91_09400 [Streptomyces regensis]TWH15957.1 hypothetical protein JD82_04945 [Prauserella rugosa]